MKYQSLFYALILLISIQLISSCSREEPYTGSDFELSYSLDTLRFDTVFTSIGSATRSVKVYNSRTEAVSIPSIRLSDNGDFFRMNVDGEKGIEVTDVIIQPEDSIYIFLEVTVDPDQPLSVSPYILEQQLIINTGDREDVVHLEAWGQNANYFPSKESGRSINLLSCDLNQVVWDDEKPYVIYGVLAIDSCTLVLPEGTEVYVHGGIVTTENGGYNDGLLIFLENGNIITQGTPSLPVIFQGDRLESGFSEVRGQWSGIRFLSGSKNNRLSHTIIKNSIVGVRVDSSAVLDMDAVQIYNTAAAGLIGVQAEISAVNCLFYNNGGSSVQATYGGIYNFTHCTMANYGNQSPSLVMTNYLCTDPQCFEPILPARLEASIVNCIMDGNEDEEVILDDFSDGTDESYWEVTLSHNIIKYEEDFPIELQDCDSCILTTFGDTLFLDLNEDMYALDSASIAEEKAQAILDINADIEGNQRDVSNPDIGCYEYQN